MFKGQNKKGIKLKVNFVIDHSTAEVAEHTIYSYADNINKYGVLQTENSRNKAFNQALRDAEATFFKTTNKMSPRMNLQTTPTLQNYWTLQSKYLKLMVKVNSSLSTNGQGLNHLMNTH